MDLLTMRPPSLRGVEILRPLGWGGSALVWLARQPALGRLCAVKQIPLSPGTDADAVLREARVLAAISNAHIVAVYDATVVAGDALIVMELLAGGSLGDWMRAGGPRWGDALRIADEVADALAASARAGIVHRDVKPSNILLDEGGGCHVADFGIATLRPGRRSRDEADPAGTPSYLSPELARGLAADAPSDVYSLGVMLYELLCGRLPFTNADVMQTVRDHASTPPPPPRRFRPELPQAVERCLLQALDKRPGRRPTATELAARLRDAMERAVPDVGRAIGRPPQRRIEVISALLDAGVTLPSSVLGGGEASHRQAARPEADIPTISPAPAEAGPAVREVAVSDRQDGRAGTSASRRPHDLVRLRRIALSTAALLAVSAAVVRFVLGWPGPGALSVTGVVLASPAAPVHCPSGDAAISGRIALEGGAGTVRYRWHRPDGSLTPDVAVPVNAGTTRIDADLTVHFTGTNPSTGSVILEVLAPSRVSSAPALVQYVCP